MTAPLHLDLETEIRDLFETKMREFVSFCAEQWVMTTRDAEELVNRPAVPSEYAKGYTDAMSGGLGDALDFWLDEELGYGR